MPLKLVPPAEEAQEEDNTLTVSDLRLSVSDPSSRDLILSSCPSLSRMVTDEGELLYVSLSVDEDVDGMPDAIPHDTAVAVGNHLVLPNNDHNLQAISDMGPNLIGPFPLRKPMTPNKTHRIMRLLTLAAAKRDMTSSVKTYTTYVHIHRLRWFCRLISHLVGTTTKECTMLIMDPCINLTQTFLRWRE